MGDAPYSLRQTLVGSGFLREAPQNVKALMRRCVVMPFRPALLYGPVAPISHRSRSYQGVEVTPSPWAARAPAPAPSAPKAVALSPAKVARPREAPAVLERWWDDPVTIGALLVVAPPIGFTALWASRHYSREGRWAISGMMGLVMSLLTALAVALTLR